VSASGAAAGPSRRFDETFLRRLESLRVVTRRAAQGTIRADRRARRRGAGMEFADHRDYAPGDDLRLLDWNLYGRMERLLVRLFEEDEDLAIDVLVDASASMGLGTPPSSISRRRSRPPSPTSGSPASIASPSRRLGETLADGPPPSRGRAQILPMLRFLDGLEARGRTSLATAARAFVARRQRHRRGLVVLVSDFYDPAGFREALELLRFARFEVVVLQITAPDEASPALRGEVRVRDVETGEERDLVVSRRRARPTSGATPRSGAASRPTAASAPSLASR